MKNLNTALRNKLIAKYLEKDTPKNQPKSTNINVLLNRVKLDQKKNFNKKLFFSTSIVLTISLIAVFVII